MARFETRVLVALLAACALAAGPGWARDLFLESPQDKGVLSTDDPAVVRSRAVRVDFDALLEDTGGAWTAEPVAELRLNLFGDVALAATLDEEVEDVSEQFAWVGRTGDGGQEVGS